MIKKITFILIIALSFFQGFGSAHAETRTINAVITYYWPGEDGSRYDCDGNRLHKGIAAVDFGIIPKGTELKINDSFTVVANDCGGRDVISRKAARERGYRCPVIDIWASSKGEAMRLESKTPKFVAVTYNKKSGGSKPIKIANSKTIKIKSSFPAPSRVYICYNSKQIHEHARIENIDPEADATMLASL